MTGLGAEVVPARKGTTVQVGTQLVKLAVPYQGPGLPNELCPFRYVSRDHRGLTPWEKTLFARAEQRFVNHSFFGAATAQLTELLRTGKIAFATCKNPLDGGRRWGRYFDAATNTVITQRVPPKKCGRYDVVCHATEFVDDVASWVTETIHTFGEIGGQLLGQFRDIVADPKAFLEVVVEAFKLGLCAMLDAEWKRKLLQAGGILAGLPPSSSALAVKIGRALCSLIAIIGAEVSKTIKAIAALVTVAEIVL